LGDSGTNEEMLEVFHKNIRSSKDESTGQEYYGVKLAYGLAKGSEGKEEKKELMCQLFLLLRKSAPLKERLKI
jgi:hypothetical protein